MIQTHLRFAAIATLLWFTGGCTALDLQKPSASVRSFNVPAASAEGVTVNFDIDVQNPNAFSVPLTQANYKLGLGGVQVVDDSLKPSASLPAHGSLPVTVPVKLSFQNLLSAEEAIVKSGGNIPFNFDGGLEFASSKFPMVPHVTVPLKYSGTLPLRDSLKAVMKDPSVLTNPDARRLISSLFGKGILGELLGR